MWGKGGGYISPTPEQWSQSFDTFYTYFPEHKRARRGKQTDKNTWSNTVEDSEVGTSGK